MASSARMVYAAIPANSEYGGSDHDAGIGITALGTTSCRSLMHEYGAMHLGHVLFGRGCSPKHGRSFEFAILYDTNGPWGAREDQAYTQRVLGGHPWTGPIVVSAHLRDPGADYPHTQIDMTPELLALADKELRTKWRLIRAGTPYFGEGPPHQVLVAKLGK